MPEPICRDCGRPFDHDAPGALTAFGMSACPACVERDHWETQERRALRGDPHDTSYGPRVGSVYEARVITAMEDAARAFALRYGVTDAWSDARLEVALFDHGLPALDGLPDRPQGMMAERAAPLDHAATPEARRAWQRVNAAHLLGHVIAGHPGGRCDGCRDW